MFILSIAIFSNAIWGELSHRVGFIYDPACNRGYQHMVMEELW